MFLRAEQVSLDFPLAGRLEHDYAASGYPLGGRIVHRNGKAHVQALENVSLDLRSGDRVAVIGHNGSGKSTLLRVLAGIYHPTCGQVSASRPVSGIFNMNLGFRQEASGYRNLVIKGLMAGRSRATIEAALPDIAEFTGLGPYLDMPLQTYSQGMAMRLAFAATTAFTDDILVMDEWIGAGDASFQEKIVGRMNDMLHAATIVVVASHSTSLLRRIANRAVWLEQGRIRAAGGLEVIDAYESEVSSARLPHDLRELVQGRQGLWVAATPDNGSHLLWNIPGAGESLQLVVHHASGANHIVRGLVQRCGAWPLAPWVRPGMRFEIGNQAEGGCAASCVIQ